MIGKSSAFEETYKRYLDQIAEIEVTLLEEKLGVTVENNKVLIPFFGKPYTVSKSGIIDPSGKQPPLEVSVVLSKYLLMCPDVNPMEDDWVSYRDFKDSGPLTHFFENSVEQPIANYFSKRLDELETSCKTLGGFPPAMELNYDLYIQFKALPKIPVLLLYNDTDDEFPSHCSVLFERRAEKFLDAESLAILGVLLSAYLRKRTKKELTVKYQ
jgi:hypothetical protein